MLREAHIPILLWLPAAVLFHLVGGGGATEVARELDGRISILRFSRGVRGEIRSAVGRARDGTEIEILEETPPEEPPEPEAETADDEAEPSDEDAPDAEKLEPPKHDAKVPAPKEEPRAPRPEAKQPDEKKADLPKPLELPMVPPPQAEEKPPEGPKPEEKLAPLPKDGRIAIQNDPTLEPDQADNPTAARIAEHANKTDEETMARHRSYDQNAPKPTGGGNPHDGAHPEPGNADEAAPGHSVDAPGEGAPRPGSKAGPEKEDAPVARTPRAPEERIGQRGVAEEKGAREREAGQGEKLPGTVERPSAAWDISPEGGDGKQAQRARQGRRGKKARLELPGLDVPGKLASRHSIDAFGLQAALGGDNLRHEQERARNVRLAKHRGARKGIDFKKYRAAIENYDPVVKLGNQTNLNAARVPFATYINQMHNRIHPIFADGFLQTFPTAAGDKLADLKLVTHVEIVLDGENGKLVDAGVVKPSGVTAFEVAALRSLEEASPYGKPPAVIVSPNGRVYLHWEFYRDPYFACTSRFAHPYLLNEPAKKEPPAPTLPVPTPPADDERRFGRR